MNKQFWVIGMIAIAIGCNDSAKKPKVDPTPTLSQTNNSVDILVDTLGFHADSATKKYEAGSNLVTKLDCLGCHKIKEKSVGPAYVDIATRYEASKENIDKLASKIIKGGSGVWGQVPMAAHPAVSAEDAEKMVRYVLSLKDVEKGR